MSVTAAELLPGVFTRTFVRIAVEVEARAKLGLEPVALEIEKRAKANASQGQHAYRTKTPARPGSGPAQISGTLVRSITHSPVTRGAAGWETRVGPGGGQYPPYSSRTTSSKYGWYLEVPGAGRSHVRYPFLLPAFHDARATVHAAFATVYAAGWGI